MDASTYFELHQAMDRILKLVRHEMYKGVSKRGGRKAPSFFVLHTPSPIPPLLSPRSYPLVLVRYCP